jgi:formiminoglutamase
MFNALEFIKNDCFGIEIDLDAIPNIASSAMTLSGFSVEELRQFITFLVDTKMQPICIFAKAP